MSNPAHHFHPYERPAPQSSLHLRPGAQTLPSTTTHALVPLSPHAVTGPSTPRSQRELPQRFRLNFTCKLLVWDKERKGKQLADLSILSGDLNEVKQKIYSHCVEHIAGTVSISIGENNRTIPVLDRDSKSYEALKCFIFVEVSKHPVSLADLTEGDLDKITRTESIRTKLKVFKYGPNLSKEYSITLENAERPALTTNRAGAPTETAHMELIAELKQNFSDVYVAQDNQYWALWATLIEVEKDPQKREMYKSSLPVQLCQFFNSPAHMADGREHLSRTRQANLLAYRGLSQAIERMERELEFLKGLRAGLWNATVAAPSLISQEIASNVGDADDIDHPNEI